MFRDKSCSFYTSTPVSIETTYLNKGKHNERRKGDCGCEEEKHDDCDASCNKKNVPTEKDEKKVNSP